jgi:riboflavin kinase/FMN adenylyltransferase
MKVHNGYNNLRLTRPVVTMGIFDGVHSGHKYLINTLKELAKSTDGESVVVTFHPHPRLVLDKKSQSGLFFLSTMDEKVELLDKEGIDHLIIIPFDLGFSRIRACDFVEDVLVRQIGTKHLVVGHDHHFGFMAEGNYDTITNCAGLMNFTVDRVSGVKSGEGFISSSLIREALISGRLEDANRWLGYDYKLTGTVIEGKKLGRILGFPTANLSPDEHKLVPADGVYAVEVRISTDKFTGILSIGQNPTVNKTPSSKSVEVHILNFNAEIYGSEVSLTFRHRLRDEKKFSDTGELINQMVKDREEAIRLLA